MQYQTIESTIGNTPLIKLQKINNLEHNINKNIILAKLEGNNPAGSVKDRPAYLMIKNAELNNIIKKGDTLIEATSGNTGIALAMAAAILEYNIILVMPEDSTIERIKTMKAYGAEIILTPKINGMEGSRDCATKLSNEKNYKILNQFGNLNNPNAHYLSTAPEIYNQTNGEITHFVSSMGTTGTIIGTSKYLKEKNNNIQIIGVQPNDGSKIPGIRKWSNEYLPTFYSNKNIDEIILVNQKDAENTSKKLAKEEGIFCGISSGGACFVALELAKKIQHATIVFIVCDRGDRYLSGDIF